MPKDTAVTSLIEEIDETLERHGFGSRNLQPFAREAFRAQIGRLVEPRPLSPLYSRQRARHLRIPGEIIRLLKKVAEPLTANALAERLREDPRYIAVICERLEEEGWLTRGEPEEKRLFLAPLTGEIVHGRNYERLQQLLRELRQIIDRHRLGPTLLEALRDFFAALLESPRLKAYRKSVTRFRNEILKVARNADNKSEVRALVGLRPFTREVTTWKLSDEAPHEWAEG
jgi:phenylpyruvate tautomerase PptA (4-oxalocrotonate tautomerase family)